MIKLNQNRGSSWKLVPFSQREVINQNDRLSQQFKKDH